MFTNISDIDMFIFSFNFYLSSYNYITLIIKKQFSSLKDIITYKRSKYLIYTKLK
jgi:hypothetical protein